MRNGETMVGWKCGIRATKRAFGKHIKEDNYFYYFIFCTQGALCEEKEVFVY